MNEEELALAKAAAEGTALGVTKSLHEIVLNLAGPASKEVGLELGDMARGWRERRAEERARRAIQILMSRRAPRRVVPIAVLLPLLEGASLEGDVDLQERWSQLIASAADASVGPITRAFGEILQELTPQDAQLLEWILDHEPETDPNAAITTPDLAAQPVQLAYQPRASYGSIAEDFHMGPDEFLLTCSRLERLGVCDIGRYAVPTRSGASGTGTRRYDSIGLRPLGIAFVQACRGH